MATSRQDAGGGVNPPALAITLQQPFASLVMGQLPEAGVKDVENRNWPTAHRGRLWIHAATRTKLATPLPGGRTLRDVLAQLPPAQRALPLGQVLGYVDLVDVIRDSPSPWAFPGSVHWILARPRPLPEPVHMTGRLRLWTCPDLVELDRATA
jgi:hypothetical protein